jgi:hypothetical protein
MGEVSIEQHNDPEDEKRPEEDLAQATRTRLGSSYFFSHG